MNHNEKFKIRFSEIGVDEKIQKYQYCNFFQEAAGLFCYKNKVSGIHLKEKGLGWVLSGYTIIFAEEQPTWNQTVSVDTWANSNRGILATREFYASTEDNKFLAKATSSWAVINLETRKPVSAKIGTKDEWVLEKFNFENTRPGAIVFPKDLKSTTNKISKWSPGLVSLDINNHVNNVHYISISINSIKEEAVAGKYLQEFRISYKREVVLGDTIQIKTYQDGDTFYQKFIRESDEVCVATTLLKYKEVGCSPRS